ncbi:MAG: GNAT family N-acetyltransferase [Clostridia bacterium]|nr:GNAT family N-acetyltransferase [Clostridia bacterium]
MNMEKVIIRKATEKDAKQILEIYKYYILNTAITFEIEIPSLESFTERIKNINNLDLPYLVAVINDKIIGYSYANKFIARNACDHAVETTIYIDKEYTKLGIGKLLYSKLEEELKTKNITNLYALVATSEMVNKYLDNSSVSFHEHLGYKIIGQAHNCAKKFNTYFNMVWMEKFI